MEVTTTLRQLQHQLERLHLGFVDIRYKTVYCNRRCEAALWYTVEEGQQIPIKQNALRGYADRLEVVSLQRRGKEIDKLQFTLNCGDLHYVLESGVESEFAQSLVYALAVLSPQQIKQPIIVQPEPGEDQAVLFAKIRTSDYRRVFVERSKLGDYAQILQQVMTRINGVATSASAVPAVNPDDQQPESPLPESPLPETLTDEPQSLSDPVNRFQTIAAWTGHKPSQLRAIARGAKLPASSADLAPEQQCIMRDAIFVDWAAKYPVWQSTADCWEAYRQAIATLPVSATDGQIWATWKTHMTHRLTEQQRSPSPEAPRQKQASRQKRNVA